MEARVKKQMVTFRCSKISLYYFLSIALSSTQLNSKDSTNICFFTLTLFLIEHTVVLILLYISAYYYKHLVTGSPNISKGLTSILSDITESQKNRHYVLKDRIHDPSIITCLSHIPHVPMQK